MGHSALTWIPGPRVTNFRVRMTRKLFKSIRFFLDKESGSQKTQKWGSPTRAPNSENSCSIGKRAWEHFKWIWRYIKCVLLLLLFLLLLLLLLVYAVTESWSAKTSQWSVNINWKSEFHLYIITYIFFSSGGRSGLDQKLRPSTLFIIT